MGIHLVSMALQPCWASLTATERLVLVTMSYHALDVAGPGRPAGIWHGGTDLLVLEVAGMQRGDDAYPSARRRIERALAGLRAAGAIRTVSAGRGWRNARYALTTKQECPVDNEGKSVDNPVYNMPLDERQTDTSVGLQTTPVSVWNDTSVGLRPTPVSVPEGGEQLENKGVDMDEGGDLAGYVTSAREMIELAAGVDASAELATGGWSR